MRVKLQLARVALRHATHPRTAQSWIAKDPLERPLVNLVSLKFSPVSAVVNDYCMMLAMPPTDAFPILVGHLLNKSDSIASTC